MQRALGPACTPEYACGVCPPFPGVMVVFCCFLVSVGYFPQGFQHSGSRALLHDLNRDVKLWGTLYSESLSKGKVLPSNDVCSMYSL